MKTRKIITMALLLGSLLTLKAQKAEKPSMAECPMMNDHAAMNARGDNAMGFSQDKTTHHFRLTDDGGTIEVSANDPTDETSPSQIRGHLGHIAKMFEKGNFDVPMFVHGKNPAGVEIMKQQKTSITYSYEETKGGGLVRIRTHDAKALQAVHEFLRFQIREHQTGDPTVAKAGS
jgi:hypothetical protein